MVDQLMQLEVAECAKALHDTISGVKINRVQLKRPVTQLKAGDVLVIAYLGRLARSTRELLNSIDAITTKQASFRFRYDAWTDSTTSHGRLMLTVSRSLAEFEGDLIRTHAGHGITRAKEHSVKLGPKHKLTSHQQHEALQCKQNGEPLTEIT